jgi:hypothetical protein
MTFSLRLSYMRMFTICTLALGAIATTHTALNTRMAGLVCVSETKAVRNRHPGPLCCQGRSAAVGCPSQMLTPRFPPARAHGPRLIMPANVFNYKFLPSSIETALTSMTISICLLFYSLAGAAYSAFLEERSARVHTSREYFIGSLNATLITSGQVRLIHDLLTYLNFDSLIDFALGQHSDPASYLTLFQLPQSRCPILVPYNILLIHRHLRAIGCKPDALTNDTIRTQ